MKRTTIIAAILLTAFTVNAQSNRSRSERSSASEPARKEEVKKSERSTEKSSRSTSSVVKRDPTNREKSTGDKQTTRPSAVDRPGNRPTYIDRGTANPRARVEHTDADRNQRVKNLNPGNAANGKYNPKRGDRYEAQRRAYSYNHSNRVVRPAPKTFYAYKPIEYRRVNNVYRVPPRRTIVWNSRMYHEYVYLYPEFRLWYYPFGYHIRTISAYDADRYIGEVARVYGEVYDVWYSSRTDEYYLYIGGPYPYQDFTIVLEGNDARRFSNRPARYFARRHIEATGLIGIFDEKPEMFIKKRNQLDVY